MKRARPALPPRPMRSSYRSPLIRKFAFYSPSLREGAGGGLLCPMIVEHRMTPSAPDISLLLERTRALGLATPEVLDRARARG